MEKKAKFNSYIIYLIIVIIVILVLVFGQKKEEITVEDIVAEAEERGGSGFLEIKTVPDDAEIFINDVPSGKSPLTIYNVGAGLHKVVIKKEGYEDFTSEVNIEAGRKSFLESRLVLIPAAEAEVIGSEEKVEIAEEEKEETVESEEEETLVEEETSTGTLESSSTINIGTKFLLYYDFSEAKFADKRNFDQDVFSKRYDTYFIFTRINPVNIKTIDKKIDDVEKEDCIGKKGQFEWLYSGQSLCVITKENQIAAIGGEWEDTENAELTYKLFI